MMSSFKNISLKLIQPAFDSPLTDLIIELEHLRKKQVEGTTNPLVFFQLKRIFHTLESIGSARIEGNNTTIAEYFETKIEKDDKPAAPNILEIQNIETAMQFVDEHIQQYPINKTFVSELHKIIVGQLAPPPKGEGDAHPGSYRQRNVAILNSDHQPPDAFLVDTLMDELFDFINQDNGSKYDLLKVAIAHHRFVWIHPFGNGNGRTVRLFTYAMLIKSGFNVNIADRLLNPTAVFCSNRNQYYDQLAMADKDTDEGRNSWCIYVLTGLKEEIEKIDRLTDYDYLKKEILLPAIHFSVERHFITPLEEKILRKAIDLQLIQNSDIKEFFAGKASSEISRQIRKLIEKKMLMPEAENARKYVLRFDNNYLLRGIIKILGDKGFLPLKE